MNVLSGINVSAMRRPIADVPANLHRSSGRPKRESRHYGTVLHRACLLVEHADRFGIPSPEQVHRMLGCAPRTGYLWHHDCRRAYAQPDRSSRREHMNTRAIRFIRHVKSDGVPSVEDIQSKFAVSRATAYRWLSDPVVAGGPK